MTCSSAITCRAEVLAHLPPTTVSFLTRTAILEHLSGPLCDAVLGAGGSARLLEELAASNLLLVPLDRRRQWYRYHKLFRDVLVADLHRSEPELVPVLHRRAARWMEANESPEAAISHAQRSGDVDDVARLTTMALQPAYAAGRATTARRWCEWFRTRGVLQQHPQVAVLGAWLEALCGSVPSAEAWTAIAEAGPTEGVLPDGTRLEGWLAYLRAVLLRDGPARMRLDAQLAQELLPPDNRLRAGIRVYEGLSHVFEGDDDAGERVLVHAHDLGLDMGALPAASAAIAVRAIIAVARKEWDDADRFAERSLDLVDAGHLEDYPGSGLAFAVGARVAVHRGDRQSADSLVMRAARLRPLFTYALPASAQIQLELARAYVELNDPQGARTVLAEMREILRQRPDLGVLPAQAELLAGLVDTGHPGFPGPSSLTKAELRLLPYLGTHLSFREIGERLYVSHHTVKTQAIAVYRKLGVSSRSEAVEYLHHKGVL